MLPTNIAIEIQRSRQRQNAAIPETWWEKENLILATNTNKIHSDPKALVRMDSSNDEGCSYLALRGWFIKVGHVCLLDRTFVWRAA
mmetsp:Transcript_10995/g.24270  ORF Transcript_10995/g.24270 Transcript_10995/m.24270 type:complete len:86 (-) Transcript_10995:173-430(-)